MKPVLCTLGRHSWSEWVHEAYRASFYNWQRHCERCGRYDFRGKDPR